jgi:hypothetical protein
LLQEEESAQVLLQVRTFGEEVTHWIEGSDVFSNTISPLPSQIISSCGEFMVHDASKRRPNDALYLDRKLGVVLSLCNERLPVVSIQKLVDFLDEETIVSTPLVRVGIAKVAMKRAYLDRQSMV